MPNGYSRLILAIALLCAPSALAEPLDAGNDAPDYVVLESASDPGQFNCGNGRLDPNEPCDGDLLRDQTTCEQLGYPGGLPTCVDCEVSTGSCDQPVCGDGTVHATEECDPGVEESTPCPAPQFAIGELRCTSDCRWDSSGCSTICGDGIAHRGERCDPPGIAEPCSRFGFGSGDATCDETCEWNFAECEHNSCGNGIVEGSEDCEVATYPECEYGVSCLRCVDCRVEMDDEPRCGDGTVQSDHEECDPASPLSRGCRDNGFPGSGTLACDPGECVWVDPEMSCSATVENGGGGCSVVRTSPYPPLGLLMTMWAVGVARTRRRSVAPSPET